jgi:hypothetical protein
LYTWSRLWSIQVKLKRVGQKELFAFSSGPPGFFLDLPFPFFHLGHAPSNGDYEPASVYAK